MPLTTALQVALADDSALFRSGLALLLEAASVDVAFHAGSAEELLAMLASRNPDIVILDMRMPPTFTDEGLRAAVRIRQCHPEVGVLILSTYADTDVAVELLSRCDRAVGYLLKDRVDDVASLVDALERIAAGESVIDPDIVRRLVSRQANRTFIAELAPREREVLELMAQGRSNLGIAQAMYLTPKTVERHIANVFLRLGLSEDSADNRRVLAVLAWLR